MINKEDEKLQLASSLLQHLKEQSHLLSMLDNESLSKNLNRKTKKVDRRKVNPSVPFWRALQWGTDCLTTELDDAFEQLQTVSELLHHDVSPKRSTSRASEASQAIAGWINQQLPIESNDAFVSIIAAGWIYALRQSTMSISSSLWLETLQNILTQVDRTWSDINGDSLIPTIVWGCEIPLALATQLDSVDGQTKLVSETRQRLSFLISRVENAQALWLKAGGGEVRAMLASCLRCCWLLDQVHSKPLSQKDIKQLQKYARAGLSLSQIGGQPVLQHDVITHDNDLWHSFAEQFPGDEKFKALISNQLLNIKPKNRAKASRHSSSIEAALPPLGQNFEPAEVAIMRRDWTSGSQMVVVDFSTDPMWIEVYGPSQHKLLSGGWELELYCNDNEVIIDSPWVQLCWVSDDDVDYLELECEAEGVCKIQRQIMLIRDEGIVFLSDTLLAEKSGEWRLKSTLAVAENIQVEEQKDNTELRLKIQSGKKDKSKNVAVVLPIALPEWKRGNIVGRLTTQQPPTDQSALVLEQTSEGTRMVCPIVIGCGDRIEKQSYTWRHLTVGEELKIESHGTARGFRVQIGSDQILFYRSLGKLLRRTMMGLHLYNEFYAGRFDSRDGEVETLIEVSTEE